MGIGKKVALTMILLFAGSLSVADGFSQQKAVEFNKSGYKYYTEKKYYAAVKEFRKAVEQDPTYLYSHYNLACSIALMFENEDFTDFEKENGGVTSEVNYMDLLLEADQHLKTTLKMDPAYATKARKDRDLLYLRKDGSFFQALGYDLSNTQDVREILYGVLAWYLPGPADRDRAQSWIRFSADGKLSINNYYWENWSSDYDKAVSGTYSILKSDEGVAIRVNMEEPKVGKTEFFGHLTLKDEKYLVYFDDMTDDRDYVGVPFESYSRSP